MTTDQSPEKNNSEDSIDAHVVDEQPTRKLVDLSGPEARRSLLTDDSYSTLLLPTYFTFQPLLRSQSALLSANPIRDKTLTQARIYDGVNHIVSANTDGRYSWRPLEFIHPVLYADLVNEITEVPHWELIMSRFNDFAANRRIQCHSLPVQSDPNKRGAATQIAKWWEGIEQGSIALALEYGYLYHTDVSSCYPSIYTHSIAWALHGKQHAKDNRRDMSLIGNIIDARLQNMTQGQTNGIPQGSILMDLIAEMVLGYADIELTKRLNESANEDYKILRFRDDYRIFVNSSELGEQILRELTEVLIDLGLSLGPQKTLLSGDLIQGSIKEDKLAWMSRTGRSLPIQQALLDIYDHSLKHPNAGSTVNAMLAFNGRIMRSKVAGRSDILQLISIATEIAFRNPKTIPIYTALLGNLFVGIDDVEEKFQIIERIRRRFGAIPNTGHLDIWLQRISKDLPNQPEFAEPLCLAVAGHVKSLWENSWLPDGRIKKAVNDYDIVDRQEYERVTALIPRDEVELFLAGY